MVSHSLLSQLFTIAFGLLIAVAAYNVLAAFIAAWIANVITFVGSVVVSALYAERFDAAGSYAATKTIAAAGKATSFLRSLRTRLEA